MSIRSKIVSVVLFWLIVGPCFAFAGIMFILLLRGNEHAASKWGKRSQSLMVWRERVVKRTNMLYSASVD